MKIHSMSKELRGFNTGGNDHRQTHQKYAKEPKISNSLMSIFPKEELKRPAIPKPKRIIPSINFSKINKPKNFAEELLKLEEEQFGLRRTIERLELAQKNGKISEDAYLRKYEKLHQRLYRVQKQIEKINEYI